MGLAAAVGGSAYAALAAASYLNYGRVRRRGSDALLDQFMPEYEIVERHHTTVAAPAETTFAIACEMDLQRSRIAHAIFRGRELFLRSRPQERELPRGLVESTKELGWGVLAEVPGREIVLGAVTQPWEPNVVFRALPPEQFAGFRKPGFVKIAWTLRADPLEEGRSVFRTETRAVATDPFARAKFRKYWSLVSPGIILIRRMSLGLIRSEARRRMRLQPQQA